MDLGTQPTTTMTAVILPRVRDRVRRQAELVDEWIDVVSWANDNVVTTIEGAATLVEGVIDTGVPIAGPGAPLVSEFNLMELIAVLGRNPDGGRGYVGRIIECAWRLPGIYTSVIEGRLAPWRAERIADLTRPLNAEAAAFVDRQLAAVGGVGWAQLERLVTEAVIRFDPERAEAERQAAADHRDVQCGEVDRNGQMEIHAQLDAADGHDFDQALSRRAILRGQLGDTRAMGVRRSVAVGDLARTDLALDLLTADADSEVEEVAAPEVEEVALRPSRDPATLNATFKAIPGRRVVLNVHITDTTLTGSRDGCCATSSTNGAVGRWEEGRTPIAAEQIKEWLQAPNTTVIVRPVIDLADHVPVDSYEIPDRIRTRVELRDHQCQFPNCSQRATKCDLDHATPHNKGGPTCPCNLVPLCRRHHRAKTFSKWRYLIIHPGTYLWTSPHGHHFLVDHTGTRALDPPRPPDPDH